MKESDKTGQAKSDDLQAPKRATEPEKQIANMDYSDFVSLLEESRII